MRAYIVQGMAWGDEGKGATVDWLVREKGAPLVVRYNGGPNAAHNVVTENEGVPHHTFQQFGSGTLAGAATHISRFALLDPLVLAAEAEVLSRKLGRNPYAALTVDPETVLVARYHVAANRARERARGAHRHGSVGSGLGEARRDQIGGLAITAAECSGRLAGALAERLVELRRRKLDELAVAFRECPAAADEFFELGRYSPAEVAAELIEAMAPVRLSSLREARDVACAERSWMGGAVLFEGAQGVLLDERYGFAPHNSWTDCTFGNAEALIAETFPGAERMRLGVFRSYFTRHGPGPFPTEAESLRFPEPHNGEHPWMGPFRQGYFDGALAAYACRVAQPDALVITHMDRLVGAPCCRRYAGRGLGEIPGALASAKPLYGTPRDFLAFLGDLGLPPVFATSRGPTAESFRIIHDRYEERKLA